MHYTKIDECEYTNGNGCGVSLYVSGCHFHCKGCFNSQIWNPNYGNLWNRRTENQFIEIINKNYIKRVSLLGGEPLANENIFYINELIKNIKEHFPEKEIWLYTGYSFEEFMCDKVMNDYKSFSLEDIINIKQQIISNIDYMIDGKFMIELKDLTLPFRGSSNQRVIDIKRTLNENRIVLFEK